MILSQRLYQDRYYDEKDFQKLLCFFEQYKDCVDEVSLMSETTMNAYYPIEEFEKTIPVLTARIEKLREMGIPSVGVNVLCTIGHHGEASRWEDDGRFQPMVNYDGVAADGCYCPNDPVFAKHIENKYRMVAKTNPDFIWLDDDMRMQMHDKALFPCFCPLCMKKFNEKNGTDFTREELVEKLNASDGGAYRKLWIEQNEDTLDGLCALIEKTVHEINPAIEFGFMHCNDGMSTYSGEGYRRWLTTLKSHKTRPGGGLYGDRMPLSYLEKIMECARSRDRYSDIVTDLQYEYEQFTYQKYIKSRYMANIEVVSTLATGFNGVAFDALKLEPDGSLEDWESFMEMIREHRGQWKAITEYTKGFHNEGANPILPLGYEKNRSVDENGWFTLPGKPEGYGNYAEIMHVSHTATLKSYVYQEIGIPLTAEDGREAVTVIEGKMAEALSDREIESYLSKAVFLDGVSLECLVRRGFGDLCGVQPGEKYSNNVMEQLTNDPINGKYAGEIRDPRLSLMHSSCSVLKPLSDDVRVLCNLINMQRKPLGAAHTLFQNRLGGRVSVITPSPYHLMLSSAKIHQLYETFDWLSDAQMPIRMRRPGRVIPTVRVSEDRKHALLLLVNGNMDDVRNVEMDVRIPVCGTWKILNADGSTKEMPSEWKRTENGKTTLTIPGMSRWEYLVLLV